MTIVTRGTALIALTTVSVASFAQVLSAPYADTDAAGYSRVVGGSSGTQGVAEFRAGGAGTEPEFNVGANTAGAMSSGQWTWVNGQAVPFTFSRTGSLLSLTLGGNTITYTQPTTGTSVFVRMRVPSGNQIALNSLTGNSNPLGNVVLNGVDSEVRWWEISGLAGDFTLDGTVAFSWVGSMPSRSNQAVQFKIAEAVPEPATMLVLGAGLAALAARRRRR